MNFELGTHNTTSKRQKAGPGNGASFDEEYIATLLRKASGYARLEERWSTSVSSLAWEATTKHKPEVATCALTSLLVTDNVLGYGSRPLNMLCARDRSLNI